jgi:transcriptional regulator with XRE-family HTH domain
MGTIKMQETREKIAERLKKTRLDLNMPLVDAAKITGLSTARISNWEQGLRTPKYDQVAELAKAYKTRPEYLVCWIEKGELDNIDAYKTVYKTTVTTDQKTIEISNSSNSTAYHRDFLKRKNLNEKNLISIIVNDESSPEEIKKGDELLINTLDKTVKTNDLFAILSNDNIWIRNIRPVLNSDAFIMSSGDKENYPDEQLSKEKLAEINIIGRVVRVSRDR